MIKNLIMQEQYFIERASIVRIATSQIRASHDEMRFANSDWKHGMNGVSNGMHRRGGFTIVEMLVVVTIVGVLIALLLPALAAARGAARKVQCQSNLRQFFIGFSVAADVDPEGRFTSGACDGRRDGCLDVWGWVADLVNSGVCRPGEMLCPSNPLRVSESVNDYLVKSLPTPRDGIPDPDRILQGSCRIIVNAADSALRGELVAAHLLAKGYNANYATTWFLSRGAPRLVSESVGDELRLYFPSTDPDNQKRNAISGLGGTHGPLTRNRLDGATVLSSVVPFVVDANVGDQRDAFLRETLPGYAVDGEQLAESFADGPARRTASAGRLIHWGFSGGGEIDVLNSAAGVDAFAESEHLQDCRDFGPVHGGDRGGACNVLFGDGSVRSFVDANGDGYLNPGFVIPETFTSEQVASVGYADSTIELSPARIYSGVFLSGQGKVNLD